MNEAQGRPAAPHRFVAAGILMLIVVAAGFAVSMCAGAGLQQSVLSITAEPDMYSSVMSSTPGIGLTPSGITKENAQGVEFVWRTDYGHFLSWNLTDYRITVHGTEVVDPALPTLIHIESGDGTDTYRTEVINSGEKIYWTYNPETSEQHKPDVHVTLTVRDAASKRILGSAMLTIGWTGNDMAQVIR